VLLFARSHGYALERKLSRSEYPMWATRLDIEEGSRTPAAVNAAALPDDVHPIVRTYFAGFVFLLGCRWLWRPNEPAPYTHEFAAAWSDIGKDQAKAARKELVGRGWILHVPPYGRLKLWLPKVDE
jgi:hypothetical protein